MACGGLRKRDGVLEQHNGFSGSTFNNVSIRIIRKLGKSTNLIFKKHNIKVPYG